MLEKSDFEAALKAVQSGQSITGNDGVLGPLVKQLTEATLGAELGSHLAEDLTENRRNGESSCASCTRAATRCATGPRKITRRLWLI